MAKRYSIEDSLKPLADTEDTPPPAPYVAVVSPDEFAARIAPTFEAFVAFDALSKTTSCHVDVFEAGFVGAFALPDKNDLLGAPATFRFFMDSTRLIFVDETTSCTAILDRLVEIKNRRKPALAHILFEFMEHLIKDDAAYLEAFEDGMEGDEEGILNQTGAISNARILEIRRKILRLDYYYQQLADMGTTLEENENGLIEAGDRHLFALFARRADRLFDRTGTIKEYSLQLHELYQTQINIRQNKTIQWLTVITTIFVPLTLITSWYGMNFENMPELHRPEAYFVIIGICLVLVCVELIYFKRKKWL
ncbi:MAG: CorA family divalent cation transporter [Raoultibacter sp.]